MDARPCTFIRVPCPSLMAEWDDGTRWRGRGVCGSETGIKTTTSGQREIRISESDVCFLSTMSMSGLPCARGMGHKQETRTQRDNETAGRVWMRVPWPWMLWMEATRLFWVLFRSPRSSRLSRDPPSPPAPHHIQSSHACVFGCLCVCMSPSAVLE